MNQNSPEDIGFRAPLRFQIPPEAVIRECRSCNAPVYWIVTPRGKRMPVDPDGTSHFATCAHAGTWRKPR